MTREIDIVINIKVSDIEGFKGVFKEGFYIYEEGLEDEIKNRRMFYVIDNDSGFKIDFIVRKNTEFHRNEFERRERKSAFGFNYWVVSVKDLITYKLNGYRSCKVIHRF